MMRRLEDDCQEECSEKLDVCGTITIFIADIELIFKFILESMVSKRYISYLFQ